VRVRLRLLPVLAALLLAGCRAGTAPQELEQLRVRASTLEAENAQLQGQLSLTEAERDQLRQQVSSMGTELAKAQGGAGAGDQAVAASQNLVVLPRDVRPGEWVAIYVRNYPVRLLNLAGVAVRKEGNTANVAHVKRLAAANLFLLPIPTTVEPGAYRIVLGEAGELGPGAKLDDQVSITITAQ
jgi:outer membrane murein-binding lipoprotein Lpp